MSSPSSPQPGPVVVNLTHLSPHMAGVLRHSAGIIKGLLTLSDAPPIEVVTTRTGLKALAIVGLELPPTMVTLVPVSVSRSKLLAAVAALTLLPLISRHKRASTILNLDYYFSPAMGRTRSVSMVTDVQYLDRPENFSRSGRWSRAFFLGLAARFADCVVSISQASADRFVAAFPAAEDRTEVVHLGIDVDSDIGTDDDNPVGVERNDELLFVGTTNAHKNLRVVVDALGRGLVPDLPLVVAGRPGSYEPELCRASQDPAVVDRIERVGRIGDDELWELYRRSNVLLAPSLYEGFDLPTVEAMAAGSHVVASDLPVHREILQEHAEYFSPEDPQSLADAIHTARSRTEEQRAQAMVHARSYSWDRSAETLGALL